MYVPGYTRDLLSVKLIKSRTFDPLSDRITDISSARQFGSATIRDPSTR